MVVFSLDVAGFRSLNNVTVSPFAPVTILAGRNGAGKSNILRALNLVADPLSSASSLSSEDFSPGSPQIRIGLWIAITESEHTGIAKPIRQAKSGQSKPLQDFARAFYRDIFYRVIFNKSNPAQPAYYVAYKKTSNTYPLWAKGATSQVNGEVLAWLTTMLKKHYQIMKTQDSFGSIPTSERNDISALLMKQFLSVDPGERARFNELRDNLSLITEGVCGEIQPAGPASQGESTDALSCVQMRSEVERSYYVPVPYMGDGAQRVALILYHIVNSSCGLLGIEEPEAGLHPGAQKRFRRVLDNVSSKYRKRLLITTHSSAFLDGWNAASLLKVDIVKGKTVLSRAGDREQVVEIAQILGISPGDALAADGIIWVEGPSDVNVYGALLSTLGVDLDANNVLLMWAGGDAMQHLTAAELKRLNPNFAVMLDSDRTSAHKRPSEWKKRLAEECRAAGAFAFITQRREIENYLPLRTIRRYYDKPDLPDLGEYGQLAPHISTHAQGKAYNKMRDSGPIARLVTKKELDSLGDLAQALRDLQLCISRWKGQPAK
jgi:predicted ATP-dependent endonuclease of OLD family